MAQSSLQFFYDLQIHISIVHLLYLVDINFLSAAKHNFMRYYSRSKQLGTFGNRDINQ